MRSTASARRHRSVLVSVSIGVVSAVVVMAGCSSSAAPDATTLSGVITEVNGDLTAVESFVVLAEDGSSHRFTPDDGLLFDGGPLTHLREHVVTGQPVVVVFARGADGELIAVRIEDA